MRYRWDPAYPMGRRDGRPPDPPCGLRTTSATRSPTSSRATTPRDGSTRSSSRTARHRHVGHDTRRPHGLFDDLPPLPSEPPPPPPRHRRILPWVFLVAFLAIAAGATMPFYPLYHVPWILFAVVGFILWRRAAGTVAHHHHATRAGPARSWTTERGRAHRTHPRLVKRDAPTPTDGADTAAAALDGALRRPARRRTRGAGGAVRVSTAHPGQVVQAQDVPVRLWQSSPAATPWCSATAPRSASSAAVTPGRSTPSSTSCVRPSPSSRCRR